MMSMDDVDDKGKDKCIDEISDDDSIFEGTSLSV
jgi:hypothetical protein